MTQPHRQHRIDLLNSLPRSPETECPYLVDCSSAMRYFFAESDMATVVIDAVLENGFRRCGDMWYVNECPGCRRCIPYRVAPDTFTPSRNMKRVLKRNADVTVTFAAPELTTEKTELYLNYQHDQHFLKPAIPKPDGDPFEPTDALGTMTYQMYENPESTLEVTMTLDDRVIGFGTLDVGETAVSLVYFAFDPDLAKRSLGTLTILKSIEWAKDNGYAMAYLGLYIKDHPKMEYKSRYRPAEIMTEDGDWVPFVG
jgi:arginyl-tRNA--protein-N-Asp/Glu arginylyltransferase